jgi:hypothetical protein
MIRAKSIRAAIGVHSNPSRSLFHNKKDMMKSNSNAKQDEFSILFIDLGGEG